MVRVAELGPAVVGVKVTLIVQLAPTSTAVLQPSIVENASTLLPVTVAELIVSGAVPAFVTVIVCTEFAVPLKDSFVGFGDANATPFLPKGVITRVYVVESSYV